MGSSGPDCSPPEAFSFTPAQGAPGWAWLGLAWPCRLYHCGGHGPKDLQKERLNDLPATIDVGS
eukprot:1551606-Prymnesium_polylepis.1